MNDIDRLKIKKRKKIYLVNTDQKKTGMAKLISDKVDLRTKNSTRNK